MERMSETLRQAWIDSGLSANKTAQATGILRQNLSRYREGGQLSAENMDKLAAFLQLELRPKDTEDQG